MLTRRRERLREQLDRLEQHGSGLGDVDAELRLVVANRRYAEIYGLKPADLRPGTPLRELMEQRDAKDEHAAKPSSLNIVRAVAALASGLGVAATAEGVETREQFDLIRSEGCTEMQNFLLSKPVPAHELEPRYSLPRESRARALARWPRPEPGRMPPPGVLSDLGPGKARAIRLGQRHQGVVES
jgi:PAS domain-containing protein